MTPSAARESGVILKAYPRISFYLTLKGDKEMEYKIIEREEFKVFGKSIFSTNVDNEGSPDILAFWGRCFNEKLENKLKKLPGICRERQMLKSILGQQSLILRPMAALNI